jgi:hypothetical protein
VDVKVKHARIEETKGDGFEGKKFYERLINNK